MTAASLCFGGVLSNFHVRDDSDIQLSMMIFGPKRSIGDSIKSREWGGGQMLRYFHLWSRQICVAALLLLATFLPASASVFLEDQTWTELRDQIAAGTTTIIIPIGGTEQNGPYMALGKHNARVKFLAEKIATKLGNALVAPVIAYVPEGKIEPPTAHMKFPGTVTIADAVFEAILESAARSFKHHGFKTIVLIGDHGSYQKDMSIFATKLNKEWAKSGVAVFASTEYYTLSQTKFGDLLKEKGFKESEIGTHAGLLDTSLMLAVDPAMVRMNRITSGPKLGASDGVYGGDPTKSSAELGQLGIDLIVNGTTQAIQNFISKQ